MTEDRRRPIIEAFVQELIPAEEGVNLFEHKKFCSAVTDVLLNYDEESFKALMVEFWSREEGLPSLEELMERVPQLSHLRPLKKVDDDDLMYLALTHGKKEHFDELLERDLISREEYQSTLSQ